MDEGIFSFFLDNFGIKTVVFVMATYALYLLTTNLPKIMESITYFQSRKIKHINEALNSEWVDDDYKKILKKDISRLYLSGTLRIKANEKEVKEIIKLSDMTEGAFNIIELHHAVKGLQLYFYNLPINELNNEKFRVEKNRILDFLMLLAFFTILPYSMFVFSQNPIKYFNAMSVIIPINLHTIFIVFMVFLLIFDIVLIITSLKQKSNTIRVLKYFINSLEDD